MLNQRIEDLMNPELPAAALVDARLTLDVLLSNANDINHAQLIDYVVERLQTARERFAAPAED